ncbi:MAG: type IV pilus twitching motility protein PilT [Chloroflexota bacterium]|nr:type IV pilus twitching motility protein PilT [Chloroflexota bacterium]
MRKQTGDGKPCQQIDELLRLSAREEASDIHLKVGSAPVLRINGELVQQSQYGGLSIKDIEGFYYQLTTPEQRARFDRELELDLSYGLPGVARFRVNVASQRNTLAIAIRRLSSEVPDIDALGLPEACRELVLRRRGLILVTGPTGSGKSTTLASMIDYLNQREVRRIITIEDPIEYLFPDKRSFITQRELGGDTKSFARALRHALRQDPDVILVGEMRDQETIAAAITAAETGHLVLSSLHTMGAAPTVDRIVDVFPPHQQEQVRLQLANILEGVLSQVLVPTVDGEGRVAAVEVMMATSAVRNMIREGRTHQLPGVIETGQRAGMQTLDQALVALLRRGLITPDTVLARASNPDYLRSRMVQNSVGGSPRRR